MGRCAHRFLIGVASALSFCGTSASGQGYGPPPTIAEAHDFLGSTFQRYSISYIVWRGAGEGDNHRGRAEYYGGRDCYSEVGTGSSTKQFAVDWSLISAVEKSGPEALYVSGQLVRTSENPGARRYANFHLYFPNARVATSVANAFDVLRRSCQSRSKFD